jgi:hypothetical protein
MAFVYLQGYSSNTQKSILLWFSSLFFLFLPCSTQKDQRLHFPFYEEKAILIVPNILCRLEFRYSQMFRQNFSF